MGPQTTDLAVSSTPQVSLMHPKDAGSSGLKALEKTRGLRFPVMAFPNSLFLLRLWAPSDRTLNIAVWTGLRIFLGGGGAGKGKMSKTQALAQVCHSNL